MYCTGAKDGHGKFLWSDGTIYKGSFSNNCFHGSGDYRPRPAMISAHPASGAFFP